MEPQRGVAPREENFLVERYLERTRRGDLAAVAEALRRSAQELTREGDPVRYVRSIYLPDDETCLDLYVASSSEVVSQATRRAGVSYDRIVACE